MGSDSAAIMDDSVSIRCGSSKSWKCKVGSEEFLIGFAGNFAEGLFIRYGFSWPLRKKESLESWLVSKVQPALQKALFERFEQRNKDTEIDWSLLIAAKPGRIFSLSICGDVEECASNFAAIGSGKTAALGCLQTLQMEKSSLVSWERAELALRVAQNFLSSVREPFHFQALV
jgi:ATP-dependent protease HslVU (ClpYQ) peptidase subunit